MSEMSHDYPPPLTDFTTGNYESAQYLAERLIQSGIKFECIPDADKQLCTFKLTEDEAKYAADQMAKRHGVLFVNYKGHSVRCYGKMHPEQNTWWATELDERIYTNGFDSWDEAVRFFIDKSEMPVVELAAV